MADVLVSYVVVRQGEELETAAFKIGEGGASRDSMHVSAFQTTKKFPFYSLQLQSNSIKFNSSLNKIPRKKKKRIKKKE